MRMPTIIKAAVVTDVVNKDRINGEMKIANVRKNSKIKVTERIGIIKSKYENE